MSSRVPAVLIADDEDLDREILSEILVGLGYHVVAAASGEEALARLGPDVDVVLLDVVMADLDGFATARRIRARDSCADVPIVMATSLTGRGDRLAAVEAGANDFVAKPFDRTELRVRLQALVRMKQAQDAIKAHQARLEELVRERTAALARALDQAVRAGMAKTAFLQTMSHELRTPLNHILGYADILAEELTDRPEARADAARIATAGRRLLGMIADVLEYARNEGADDLDLEDVDVAALVRGAVRDRGAEAEGNTLTAPGAPSGVVVCAHEERLRRVIDELLGNAVKFTRNGQVSATVGTEGDHVVVVVADTGIGMTAEQLERCFDPFWQAEESLTRQHEGTGIGLALALQLTRQLGGELTAQGEPGRGCTFTLRLPRAGA